MRKFTDCNIIEILQDIMRHNTEHYQSDFEYDKNTIFEAAYSHYQNDKSLIWISRRNGTHCFNEREVYVKDTSAYNTVMFYGERTSEPVIAYAVDIDCIEDGWPTGNLYELDPAEFCKKVKEKAVDAHHVLLIYQDSVSTIPYEPQWGGKIINDKLKRAVILPVNLKKWDEVLDAAWEERHQGACYSEWDFTNLQNSFTVPQKSDMEM